MKNAKQYIIGVALVGGILGYSLLTRQSAPQTTALADLVVAATSANTVATGQYKDGTYTGSVQDAFYGNLQVEAVVSGGKLTDVAFLQYPSTTGNSTNISNTSLPILKQEAISAQSANVNTVSRGNPGERGVSAFIGIGAFAS